MNLSKAMKTVHNLLAAVNDILDQLNPTPPEVDAAFATPRGPRKRAAARYVEESNAMREVRTRTGHYAPKKRKPRSDKGKKRGPRKAKRGRKVK